VPERRHIAAACKFKASVTAFDFSEAMIRFAGKRSSLADIERGLYSQTVRSESRILLMPQPPLPFQEGCCLTKDASSIDAF
jgi:hypothetical protein